MKKDKRASTVTPFIPEEEVGTDEWTDEGLRSQAIEDLATRVARLERKTDAMWEVARCQTTMIRVLAEYLGFEPPRADREEDGHSPGD